MGDTIERAEGRWRDILALNGVDAKFLTGKAGPCPMCGGKDRFTFDDKGEGMYLCRGCGSGYGQHLLMKFRGWTCKQALDAVDAVVGKAEKREGRQRRAVPQEERLQLVRQRWEGGVGIFSSLSTQGNNVRRYLEGRGIDFAKLRRERGFGRVLDIRESSRGNMIALVRDATGMPCQLHCTRLTDGKKANVERVRLFMKLPIPDGAAVRLFPLRPEPEIGIAEGIETALSAAQLTGTPTWAALNTAMLRKWRPPEGIKVVHIFADNDDNFAGHAAAYHLAHRLKTDGKLGLYHVNVVLPERVGRDWNDELRAEAAREPSTGLVAESEARC